MVDTAYRGLLISDVDSTFLTQEVIELVADYAGVRDDVEEVTLRAMRGELDFAESLHHRVAALKGLPATVIDEVREQLVPTPGAVELASEAIERGWLVALVSGGFEEIITPLAEQVGIQSVLANRFEVADGHLTGRVDGPIVDREAKAMQARFLSAAHGVPRERIIALGDGANDIDLMAEAGLAVGFHPKPALREVVDLVIDGPSLDPVREHLARLDGF
ncbi:phosphoserine phosphatase SerB [Helcobacillus massiliensis]|uniref:phosphoserine phosphatase SerB n=1 Tax=Helcobacillus TaxID=1161125 RepID=UPI001EF415BC|nr:phosphoserine phosphatase SerB [Helcobacillus massiliensis]MCG7426943.1 phosphoserine phosphatase SerB [Helcobacillus sp. ACRRO]MCT1557050.1 phosphoserine phosphatase SerB [Helcobacillus massiliensis]MCT2035439.1 phosphoserine phosphatase SerB [Helcobacillus massiliensis]MCT2331346.1 phosphoserine phosphatase SerB [Helcobacillus massiliensis]